MTHRLLVIFWFQDSPYGTYVQGDSVEVFWDDATNTFSVTKNGSPQGSSAADIPENFNYSGNSQSFYKQEYFQQQSICDVDDLLTFERKAVWPYLQFTRLLNHPTCDTSGPPATCDLQFDALPIVTNASDDDAFDGQITVSASGTNGAVKYRINANFEYNDGTGQSSGTFTGLGKGNYLIYARDALNCLQVQSVTVGVDKTYGTLYQLEYYDERIGYHNKTEILEKNYSGSVTEVKGGEFPTLLTLRGEGYKDKFVPVLSTEMTFTMQSETEAQFSGLYTNDPEKYRMRHSIDTGGGYEVVWIGKVLPNQYEEDYGPTPYLISATAVDGLALLNNEYLVDDDDNRLTGEFRTMSLIAWILKKIGLDLNIRCGCNIYATGMDTTAADDPLDQSYVDVYRYYLITDIPTCLDVLKYILEPYGAQIILYNNVWNIIRTEERANSFDYREFDSNGDYVSNSSYDPVKNLKFPSESNRLAWMGIPKLIVNPGYGNLRLIYNLGLKDNLLLNGDFSVKKYSTYQATVGGGTQLINGTIPDLTGFQLINNGTTVEAGIEDLGDGNIAVKFITTEKGAYIQSEIQTLKLGNSETIQLTVAAKLFTTITTGSVPSDFFHYLKLRVEIIYGDYFLTPSGEWALTTYIDVFPLVIYVPVENQKKYITFEIQSTSESIALPSSYVNGQDFQVKVYLCNAIDYGYSSFTALRAVTTIGYSQGQRSEVFISPGLLHYYELQNNTDAESEPTIIRPDDYNASTNPYQWVRVAYVVAGDITTTTALDKVQVQVITAQRNLPETANLQKPMENDNPLPLDKIIYHGSLVTNGSTTYQPGLFPADFFSGTLVSDPVNAFNKYYLNSLVGKVFFTANSADIIYAGYIRDTSGAGYTRWSRDSVAESAPLEEIYLAMYTAQYNKPWQMISGNMVGDILFTPIDVIYNSLNDKKYFPVAMEIDYRRNQYKSIQFLELTDVSISAGDGVDAEFNTDFNLDFTA